MSALRLQGKRVALYARFSSSLQREASIGDQIRRCTAYVRAHGGTVDDSMVFTDAAVSGASLSRPAFDKMMSLVNAKPVDAIVTEDMSRISRDFADAAQVFNRLRYLDVALIGVADGVDSAEKHHLRD